ncbi:LolA family protein [Onishia taeanensis]
MIARLLPVLLSALLLPLALASPSAQAFDLEQLERRLTGPDRLQGNFRQLHWLAEQEVRLHSQGRFLYQRDGQLLWLFESPTRQVLIFTPDQLTYGPANEAGAIHEDLKALLPSRSTFERHLVALIGGHFSALEEDYRLELSGDREAWQVTLHPRAWTLQLPLTTLTLSGSEHLERLDMAIANGDAFTLRLSDTREVINASLVPWLVNWLTGEPLTPGEEAPIATSNEETSNEETSSEETAVEASSGDAAKTDEATRQ